MASFTDTSREDPLVSFNFKLELDSLQEDASFTEISGMGSETETAEQKVVSNGLEVILKVPGRLKWGDITLKRGITSNMDLWDWRKKIEDGDVKGARTNGSVVMMDQQGNDVARWDFENAWPSKISGPAVKSDGNDFGIEEMTVVHEYIKRTQ